jgi:DNA-binding NarL/FixJ family response regulator
MMIKPQMGNSVLCPILVGRNVQFGTLKRLIDQTLDGEHPINVALIAGEAGIGKSRLASVATTYASGRGYLILQGRCFEPDQTLPYAPFLDLLHSFCASQASTDIMQAFGRIFVSQTQNAAPLLNLLPELAEYLPDVEPAPPLEPEEEKRRLFQSFTQFFNYIALEQAKAEKFASPLHIVIEDLHWCDEDSLDLLFHLAYRLVTRRALFVLTYRNDETYYPLQSFLAKLDRARITTEIILSRLSARDVETMIRAIFGQPQLIHPEFVSAIYELTDGNPFFIEETLKVLVGSGDLDDGTTGWARKSASALLEGRQLPRTVQETVGRRMQILNTDAARILTLAAVAGRHFDFNLLQRLTGHDEQYLITMIKELITAQLVIEESADVFAFRHALTRQAVYASLLARERRALHFTIAETMENLYANSLDNRISELAYQFFEAGVWDKALSYSQKAGESACRLYAQRTAIEHFTRAITAAQMLAAPLTLPSLFRARGEAYELLGDFDSARGDYEAALEVAQTNDDPRAQWQVWLNLASLWAARDYTRMGDILEKALLAVRRLDDPVALAQTLNRLGNWHMNVEHAEESIRYHTEALSAFEKLQDQRGLAQTYDLLGMTSGMLGDFIKAVSYYEQAATLFRKVDDRGGLGSVLSILGARGNIYLLNTGVWPIVSLEECLREMETAVNLMREVGSRPGEALALAWLAQVHATAGNYGRALELSTQAVTLAEEIAHRQFASILHWVAGAIHLDIMAFADAQSHLEQSLNMARESEAIHWVRTAAAFLASTHILKGDLPQAESILQSALTPDTSMQFNGQRQAWVAQAEFLLAVGKPDEALVLIERLIASAPNVDGRGEHAIPRLGFLRGEVLTALNRLEEAEVILRAAGETTRLYHVPGMEWRIHAALSRVLRGEESERETQVGKEIIESLASSIANESLRETFVRKAMGTFPPAPMLTAKQLTKKQYGGLTTREREVAARVAQGKTNRAIAEELVLSERTVEKHIENIMAKLGSDSRAQIAVWAVENGLRE